MSHASTPAQCCMFGERSTHATRSAACAILAGVMCIPAGTALECARGGASLVDLLRYLPIPHLRPPAPMQSPAATLNSDKADLRAFQDALANAVSLSGLERSEADRLYSRMKAHHMLGVSKVAHFEGGLLRGAEGAARAAAIDRYKNVLIGGGPGASPADSPELTITLSDLVDSCLAHFKGARDKKESKDTDSEEVFSKKGYGDLLKYQGKHVPLDSRLSHLQVGKLVKAVSQNDCLESIPGVLEVRFANRAGSQRQATMGNMSDGSALVLSVQGDGAPPTSVKSYPQVHHNLRALIYAMCAALSRPISATSFGGGDSGIVSVPGEGRQVRVQLDLETAEQLIWRLVSATAEFTSLTKYVAMIDHVLFEFVRQCEPLKMHPSEVIDLMIGTTPAIFKPANYADTPAAAEAPAAAGAAPAAPAAAPTGGGGGGASSVCTSWLANGNCRKYVDGTCPASHPLKLQGALRGSSGRRMEPYPQQNWGGSGGWGGGGRQWGESDWSGNWAPPQNWNQDWNQGWGGGGKWSHGKSKKSGGKGKGKGGKGKGKGKW